MNNYNMEDTATPWWEYSLH